MARPRASGSGRALLVACTLCWSFFAASQAPVPPLTGHVTDQTGTLTAEQKVALEEMLTAFEARKGSQLAVLMVASTAPEEIEQYALRVGEQWKLGRKKVDDGAILVVAKNDRALRIEVGARTSSTPTSLPIALAVPLLSPDSMMTFSTPAL